jgi:hypothetical protein
MGNPIALFQVGRGFDFLDSAQQAVHAEKILMELSEFRVFIETAVHFPAFLLGNHTVDFLMYQIDYFVFKHFQTSYF